MRSLTHFVRSPNLNEQTLTVPSAIVHYLPSSVFPERRPRKRKKKKPNTFSAVEDFNSFWWNSGTQQLIGKANQKQTRSTTKQDFSGEALSKHNIKALLASLACDSSRAPTERFAIFAFGVYYISIKLLFIYLFICLFIYLFIYFSGSE